MKNNDNNFEWTEELIQHHLDNKDYQKLNIKDEHGNTGFIVACLDKPELAEIMLERNDIDFNVQNDMGKTGFIYACKIYPELAEIMLERDDIDFNIQDTNGDTGFMIVCERHPKLAKMMLENNKIDKTLKDKYGLTGYNIAKTYNSESLETYQAWLAEQEKNNINSQVQKRSKKPSQHL